jgi:DNA-binding NarL/FixJ family response regulator
MTPIRTIVVHPKEILRYGLLSVLENQASIKVVGDGASAKDAVKLVKEHDPDTLILGDQLKGEDSFDVSKKLLKSSPGLKVLMIGVQENTTYMARAASAGVHDYLFEGSTSRQIVDSIKNSIRNKCPTGSYGRLLASLKDRSSNPAVELTPRELQVLRHIGYGLSNEEIANSLEISVETIKEHVQNILRKMAMKDRTQVAVWAVREGLV